VELILVVVGAIVVTAVAHRRGLEPALIMVVIGSAVSFRDSRRPNWTRTSC
jgi:CPA1 family monovalent cation:H+ antiporter